MSTTGKYFEPGDVGSGQADFDVTITKGSKFISITPMIDRINIYENIEREYVYAEITLVDALNVLSSIELAGDEEVYIRLASAGRDGDDETCDYLLSLFGHTPISDYMGKASVYTLRCVSYSYLLNSVRTLDRTFNNTISSIVKDIATKDLNIFKFKTHIPTKGIVPFTAPRSTPFDTIGILKEMAVSDDSTGGVFVFFENRDGQHFTTLEKLSKGDGSELLEYTRSTTYNTNAGKDFDAKLFNQIIEYSHISKFNSSTLSRLGAINNQIISFDIATNSLKKFDFNLKEKSQSLAYTNGSKLKIGDELYDRVSNGDPYYKFISRDSLRPDDTYYSMLGHKISYAGLFFSNTVRVKTYGDTKLTVGDKVKLELPPMSGLTKEDEKNKSSSGEYVVVSLLRTITGENSRFKYYNTFDCCRVGEAK